MRKFAVQDLPRTSVFTDSLPPDQKYPTANSSHAADRSDLGPRLVNGALYTFVRPDPPGRSELLATSPAALRDLAIDPDTVRNPEFLDLVSGREILHGDQPVYPWAQCYGGYQFGQWAGQLGDGRAISLFETTNPNTQTRYEMQLKGAGKTPYSRFADGRAVLRSSIREFVVSEALNALRIPTTRALSLVLAPEMQVRRERLEPGAIVARFAPSWIRVGTFDLPRSRGQASLVRKLADYVAENVFAGWESLPSKLAGPATTPDVVQAVNIGVGRAQIQGEGNLAENRYSRLYREIVRRNARTVAAWQAYAFTNGVLNTDNTSIMGLSLDFGPFAFLDDFDPNYSPNHDDHMLRYSYRNQPDVILWNLVRLGESFAQLIGSGPRVDEPDTVDGEIAAEHMEELVERAETIIASVSDEYRTVLKVEYERLMTTRLGLKLCKATDPDALHAKLLNLLEALELDYHHTFRRLSSLAANELETREQRLSLAGRFFHSEGLYRTAGADAEGRERVAEWLDLWRARVIEDWGTDDMSRQKQMKSVNPNVWHHPLSFAIRLADILVRSPFVDSGRGDRAS